ncbi:hypothetical protein [Desulfuribacillus alkaliarsenatis]|uniref:DUF8042 domain-containing protein n=1 Tax=Desulfuribacillus alkaliarsenatis TaxID=766136 RepID=A0A1E5G3S6_9FIRM|nr:hypothetical protein [Desulfuribacillus alkaliarsenatis]OEF97728.1 hypothetical protein BHF68_14115 [Desulfuribacillus alkaliarsenatis]
MSEAINNVTEVADRLIDLTDIVEDGFEQINVLVIQHRFDEAILLLQDVVNAVSTMQKAVNPLLDSFQSAQLAPVTKNLMESIAGFVSLYQEDKKDEIADYISSKIIPCYNDWKEQVKNNLKPRRTN